MKCFVHAAIAAFLFDAAEASAATCTVGMCNINSLNGTTVLDVANPISIEDEYVTFGSYVAEGTFQLVKNFGLVQFESDVSFDQPPPGKSIPPAGFADLAVEFLHGGISLGTFKLTEAKGISALLPATFVRSLLSDSDLAFRTTGQAFRNSGAALGDHNMNLTAVQLPAAAWLALSGFAGLLFAGRPSKRR